MKLPIGGLFRSDSIENTTLPTMSRTRPATTTRMTISVVDMCGAFTRARSNAPAELLHGGSQCAQQPEHEHPVPALHQKAFVSFVEGTQTAGELAICTNSICKRADVAQATPGN